MILWYTLYSIVPCHERYESTPPNPPTHVPQEIPPGVGLEFALLGRGSLLALLQRPDEGEGERHGTENEPDGEVQTLQGGRFTRFPTGTVVVDAKLYYRMSWTLCSVDRCRLI